MLDGPIDIQRLRQHFDAAVRLRQVAESVRTGVDFVTAPRHGRRSPRASCACGTETR